MEENKLLNKYKPYLFETIKLISNEILKNPTFEINSMEGFNRKFRLDYSISGISRSTSVLIYNKDDCLHFRIGNIGSSDNYISGIIKQTNNKITSEFNYGNYKGKLEYDPLNSESLKEIYEYKDGVRKFTYRPISINTKDFINIIVSFIQIFPFLLYYQICLK